MEVEHGLKQFDKHIKATDCIGLGEELKALIKEKEKKE